MRPGTATRNFLRSTGPLTGEWEDIGSGCCLRCRDTRRLYKPLVCPEVAVCAPCSQIYAKASLVVFGNEDRCEEEAPKETPATPVEEVDEYIDEESFSLVEGRLDVVPRRVAQRAASRRRRKTPLPFNTLRRLH